MVAAVIKNLVLFRATGDLAGRFLLPALTSLHAAGTLPPIRLIGAARGDLDDDGFKKLVGERLERSEAQRRRPLGTP
jgi:glucose-6-phosphate 1-dehydrogenase